MFLGDQYIFGKFFMSVTWQQSNSKLLVTLFGCQLPIYKSDRNGKQVFLIVNESKKYKV